MAGNIFVANTTAETALASSSEKCLIRIKSPSSIGIKIKEWGVYFDGVSATASPVVVQLCAVDTSYGEYTTHVPLKRAGNQLLSQCVVQTMNTSSVCSKFGIYANREVHPQSGYQEKFAYGDEIIICGSATVAGGAVGLIVNSPTTVNVMAEIVYEE